MKRTAIDLLWSEIEFEIEYIIVIEVTNRVIPMYLLYNGSTS